MAAPTRSRSAPAAPPDLPAQWALDFARGFAAECASVGASVVGGDLTRADEIVIAVTVIGACTRAPVVRSGAVAGDVLAITGRQGWAAGGLAVLGRGFRSPRVLVEAYRRPQPPYAQGPACRRGGRDLHDRHLRRPARRGEARPTRAVSPSTYAAMRSTLPSPSSPWAPRSVPTRCSSCSAAATTMRCSRPSPVPGTCRRVGRSSARSARVPV
ncbi:AIR synthase related protein [Nocardioides sp. B-3]|uniref:AIR synthase related protein n=1 Tax=Nocardioides sp. B-3 TaxID=2895565 RepID=UPI003FA534FC